MSDKNMLWIRRETLVGIANAIRSKKGTTDLIPVPELETEILSIVAGDSSWCGEYVDGTIYKTGAIVSYEGNIYICIKDLDEMQDPTFTEYWQMLNEEGTDTSDATATADKVLEGETFYGADGKKTGTMENNGYGVGDFTHTLDADNPRYELNGAYGGYVNIETEEKTITANGTYNATSGKVISKVTVAVPEKAVDEWDGTGTVITPITPEAQPSITINGATYNVVEGMTWFTWASNEEYNTDNFQCLTVDSKVFEAESENYVIDSDGNAVYGEDLITVGGVYSIEEPTDELAGTWLINSSISPNSSNITISGLSGNFEFFTYDTSTYEESSLMTIVLSTTSTHVCRVSGATGRGTIAYNSFYTSGGNIQSQDAYGDINDFNKETYSRMRYITINSQASEVTNGDTLLTWLKANASKQ